ncbi:10888_t:CDS:2 [Entrophospora sp. SA101]|nr:10888_t:CDS:2 [Entrophospora sp. SA101]CAJ0881461.1 4792_t:CDS:2 [Entrophospora sp. SA101]
MYEGIITVNEDESTKQNSLEPELSKLDKIPKFEPLVKPNVNDSGFSLIGFWNSSNHSMNKNEKDRIIIMDTVKHVDEYCARISQSMLNAQLQTKINQEQINVGKWPTLHKLFIKQQKLLQQPNNHLKPFQFETKRVSLHQPKAYTNVVAVVSFDNVLSDKHQDLDDILKSTKQSTNKSTDKSNTPTSTIAPPSISTTSIESVVSDRLKEFVLSNNNTS